MSSNQEMPLMPGLKVGIVAVLILAAASLGLGGAYIAQFLPWERALDALEVIARS